MPHEVELVVDAKAALGEGPIWDDRNAALYWVDIDGCRVHVFNPETGEDRAVYIGEPVGTVVPRASGGVVVALRSGFAHVDLATGTVTPLATPREKRPDLRFNDGKCDPAGRLWAGTITSHNDAGGACLYRLDTDLGTKRMLTGITNSNGLCWSLDASVFYYIDTPTQQVAAFDYDEATGEIANRRVAVQVPEEMGHPDGMTIDAEGKLWVACWGGWRVTRWDPATGKQLDSIPIPADHSSACAFGGPDLDELYVTTARTGLSDADFESQPHAGGLFRVRPGVKGIKAFVFAG
jgi:sugar lactone lactonase YvrE